jgi:flagellar basal body-associated protein FliL
MSDKKHDKAEKKEAAPAPDPAGGEKPAKKGLPVKLLGIVAVVMIAEAGLVFFVAKATGPKAAVADVKVEGHDEHDEHAPVEVPLIEEKFQNMQSGRAYIWDTSIVLKVRTKDEELVTAELKKRAAEVKEGVALIFRKATHTQLTEPGLETINRQLLSYMNNVIEGDAEGKPRILRVVMPKCKGFAAD